MRIEFVAQGEGFLPAAFASMIAKYLRERAMEALNSFWQKQVPGLKPTAGYPVDAQRFWRETAAARHRLAIPDSELWRQR
jgi:ribonuclease HII